MRNDKRAAATKAAVAAAPRIYVNLPMNDLK